jgi:RNA polymerase sigma-70 factor (sigma-E family)
MVTRGWEDERFTEFVRVRGTALQSYANRLTNSPQDAEDLLQDALVRCAMRWSSVLAKDDPEGYVRRAIARQAMNRWRRPRREISLDVIEVPEATTQPEEPSSQDDLWVALARLPPRQRVVLVLRYYEDLTEREIADALGITPGTVKSQAARGLTKLRDCWQPTYEELS